MAKPPEAEPKVRAETSARVSEHAEQDVQPADQQKLPIHRQFLATLMQLRQIILLGISFCLLFTAYNALQSYQTSVNGVAGFYSLAVLYIVFAVTCMVAPAFVRTFPLRPIFIISASTYVLYIAMSIWGNFWALIVAGAIEGVGAAFLWTAQAVFLVRWSKVEDLGRNNGVFYGIFQMSVLLGFVIATVFLLLYNSPHTMFILLTAIGAVGTVFFWFLPEPPRPTDEKISFHELLHVLLLFKEKSTLLLIPLIFYIGSRGALVFGSLPARYPEQYIGLAGIAYGAAEVTGGLVFGKLSDVVGRRPIVFVAYLLESAALALSGLATGEHVWAIFGVMILFGYADALFNTQIPAILPVLQPDKIEAIIGFSKAMGSAASSVFLFIAPQLQFEILQVILIGFLVTGVVCLYALDRFVRPIDPPREGKLKPLKSLAGS